MVNKSMVMFMFYFYESAIDTVLTNYHNFVNTENKFSRERKFNFKDMVSLFLFNKGSSNQNDLDDFLEDKFDDLDISLTRQNLSKQRTFIDPLVFKEISKQYLKNINYNPNNSLFKTYKGFFLIAGDGSDFEIPDFDEVRAEFGIKNNSLVKREPSNAKFSGLMDVLNGFILDGIIGNHKQAELPLMHQNLKNSEDIINPTSSILIFDRGYAAMELYAHIIEMNSYFVVRLQDNFYKKERKQVQSNDEEIKLYLTAERLKRFKDPILKEKYSKEVYLELRIVTIELEKENEKTGEIEIEIETLLTNLPKNIMTTEDICEIYHQRWGIETNYNTLKNRYYIENYTGKRRITIEQDIYSKFLRYNIFCHYKTYLNFIINKRKRKQGITEEYQVDQANLIRKLKKYLPKMILNPAANIIRRYTLKIIRLCTKAPNKIKKDRKVPRRPTPARKFNMNYRLT